MKCPYCGHTETKVVLTREHADAIRRRRECLECAKRVTTYERIERPTWFVRKRDGRIEPFQRTKVLESLRRASEKRPLSAREHNAIITELEDRLQEFTEDEVASKIIGEFIMERLRQLDDVAYIRFASVYRQFKDVEQFTELLNQLQQKAPVLAAETP